MPKPKQPDKASGESAAPAATAGGRKPWKKKTPVQVVLDQADKLKQEIADIEEDLKQKRKQLLKFEEARKIFENM